MWASQLRTATRSTNLTYSHKRGQYGIRSSRSHKSHIYHSEAGGKMKATLGDQPLHWPLRPGPSSQLQPDNAAQTVSHWFTRSLPSLLSPACFALHFHFPSGLRLVTL